MKEISWDNSGATPPMKSSPAPFEEGKQRANFKGILLVKASLQGRDIDRSSDDFPRPSIPLVPLASPTRLPDFTQDKLKLEEYELVRTPVTVPLFAECTLTTSSVRTPVRTEFLLKGLNAVTEHVSLGPHVVLLFDTVWQYSEAAHGKERRVEDLNLSQANERNLPPRSSTASTSIGGVSIRSEA